MSEIDDIKIMKKDAVEDIDIANIIDAKYTEKYGNDKPDTKVVEKIVEKSEISETPEKKQKKILGNGKFQQLRKKDDNKFNREERDETIEKFITCQEKTKWKLRRKEKKMIRNAEYDSTAGRFREITIGLAVMGIIVVVLLRSYLPNTAMFALLVIIGATSFLPTGMILGWLLFDPVMRCKVLRKVSRKNYGIVNFVGHGNKAFPKIKNFDQSLIWKQNECWVIAQSRVYQMTKDGNAINKGKEIDADSVLTYVDTVPVIFIDMHSMEPITISKEGRTAVYPGEIGSALKAWVDNQRAKMMAVKKMTDTMLMVAVVACIGAVIVSFVTMGKVDELTETIKTIKEQLQFIIEGSP